LKLDSLNLKSDFPEIDKMDKAKKGTCHFGMTSPFIFPPKPDLITGLQNPFKYYRNNN
jgi:hypothetical protein